MTEIVSSPPSGQQTPIGAPAESGPSSGRPEFGFDAHERAGAGADRVDLDQRHVEHEAGDVRGRGDLEAPVGDQRDVERRAADVGAEHVRQPEPLGEPLAADDAADRAGDERSSPARFASIEIVPPWEAITRSSKPAPASFVWSRTALQAAARGLGRVGLDQGGVQAREVAAQRVELRGEEDGHLAIGAPLRLLLLEDLADAELVLGVAVAEEQADADPLDAGVAGARPRPRGRPPRAAAGPPARRRRSGPERPSSARAGRAARCGSGSRGGGGRSRSSRGRSGCRARSAGSPPGRR